MLIYQLMRGLFVPALILFTPKQKPETAQRSALRNLFKIKAGTSIKLCLLFLLLDLLC
jgi:hypothetical protein